MWGVTEISFSNLQSGVSSPRGAVVDDDDLERQRYSHFPASAHTRLMTTHDIATSFEVYHRVVEVAPGVFCDAPASIRIVFELSQRVALLARSVAQDSCVRETMREHEAVHLKADGEALDRFIVSERDRLQASTNALKHRAASSRNAAVEQWEAGLRSIVIDIRRRFLMAEEAVIAQTDAATLQQLKNVCGGKLWRTEGLPRRDL
jgi:hypothetical protein